MNKKCLIVRPDYFDRILSGELTQWFLPVTPRSLKDLIQLNKRGFEVEDVDGSSIPVHYDAIEFMTCNVDKWNTILVEIKDAHTEVFANEDGNPFWYEHSEHDWLVQQVVYDLGKIIEKNLYIPRNEQGERLPLAKPKKDSKPILDLVIDQDIFNRILNGKLNHMSCEINTTVSRKLVETESDGIPVWSGDFNSIPLHYDAIRFYAGRNRGRDSMLVEVTDIYTEISVIDGDQVVYRRLNGEDWFLEDVVYVLGKIIRKNIHQKPAK